MADFIHYFLCIVAIRLISCGSCDTQAVINTVLVCHLSLPISKPLSDDCVVYQCLPTDRYGVNKILVDQAVYNFLSVFINTAFFKWSAH